MRVRSRLVIAVTWLLIAGARLHGGACCLSDAACYEMPESICDVLNGVYQGDGSACAEAVCESYGPCCFGDFSCQVLAEDECALAGGTYLGPGPECVPSACPLVGACCMSTGGCVEQPHDSCAAAGGVYLGFGVPCVTAVCTGGCSFDDGACIDGVSNDGCVGQGGNPLGPGRGCDTVEDSAVVQIRTATFSQNGEAAIVFEKFDDAGGSRDLRRVKLEVDGGVHAAVMLTNKSSEPIESRLWVDERLAVLAPMVDPDELVAIDLLDEIIECDPPTVPPGGSCDYGSPFSFIGSATTSRADPVSELSEFVGPGKVDAHVAASGRFTYLGSGFVLSQAMHRVEVTVRLIYEFVPAGACCLPSGACGQLNDAACALVNGEHEGEDTLCAATTCPQPGVCCLPDGSCVPTEGTSGNATSHQRAGNECQALGGAYQGDDTECSALLCPPPMTACCMNDGACRMLVVGECIGAGGAYEPSDTDCADVVCRQPGVCCLPDGWCMIVSTVDGSDCTGIGGVYHGSSSNCSQVFCPRPGACCLPGGACETTELEDCLAAAGDFQGFFRECDTVECPLTQGACCFADGTCGQLDEDACGAAGGGSWHDGSTCDAAQCPPPPGACCLPGGSCQDLPSVDACTEIGGVWQGGLSECDSTDCPLPEGACCLNDGSCTVDDETACLGAGGLYQGDDATCREASCAIGACCLGNGLCAVLTPAVCAGAAGSFLGDGTFCEPDGPIVLDFETEDDFKTPLVNGQDVTSGPEFGRLTLVSSAGPGHLGPAIFDSTPGGPNAGGPNPALLVDLENLLIIQSVEQPAQGAPGVFDVPSGAPDGGLVLLDFLFAVTPLSVDLVGIDADEDRDAIVTLVDRSGKTRSYEVPAGWTRNLAGDGPNGFDTLDLTTLEAQLGEGGAEATAFEMPGFASSNVVRIELELFGVAAIDNLALLVHPCSATATVSGACCFDDGSCAFGPALDCFDFGGLYQGDDTECASSVCPLPFGACCLADTTCLETTVEECVIDGGVFMGDGTACASVTCPESPKACCLSDGSCQILTPSDCATVAGKSQLGSEDCGLKTCF